jgi:predicted MPP superfamily phosphohydrolase
MGRPIFRVPGSKVWNLSILTLMIAGVSVAYAAAELAEGAIDPGTILALRLFSLAGATFSLFIFYVRFIEPFWIVITKYRVPFPVAGLRIAVIGDFHVGPHKQASFVTRAVRRTNALRPDLVLLVGDFLFDEHADIEHLEPLKDLRARLGVFAVTGNHDSGSDHVPKGAHRVGRRDRTGDLDALLSSFGIRFLRNASESVGHGDASFIVAGIDDLWMESCDLRRALRDLKKTDACILLSHQPDVILDPASHRADLIVSGHTHGGQMRLPWWGSLSHMPQRLNKNFDRGIFSVGGRTTLAITHGIGETFVPLRLFARPEILLLETR